MLERTFQEYGFRIATYLTSALSYQQRRSQIKGKAVFVQREHLKVTKFRVALNVAYPNWNSVYPSPRL